MSTEQPTDQQGEYRAICLFRKLENRQKGRDLQKEKGNTCTQNLPAPASAGQVNPVAGRPLPSPALGRCDQSTQSSSLLWTTLNFVTLVPF